MNRTKNNMMWLVWLSIPLALVTLLVIAGAAGYLFYVDSQYDQAVFSLETREYTDAQDHLEQIPSFFKDTPDLMIYAQAGEALEQKDYYNARIFFERLGSFKDSREMLREVDYRQGVALLEAGSYAEALAMLGAISDYKDSSDKMDIACKKILGLAGEEYKNGNYDGAGRYLEILTEHKKLGDAVGKYLALIQAHEKTLEDGLKSYAEMKVLYQQLTELGDFEDAEQLRVTDPFILYRLEGKWRYGSTEYMMEFRYDAATSSWYHSDFKFDWIKDKIEDRTEFTYEKGQWVRVLRFNFTAEDTMEVVWVYGGDTEIYVYQKEK